ncbi:unnamed protein product [marine sediment metagenome]|uniref:DUF1737 domain-containing protein n=1 Tax=marine sediment metagenome TaxID=412755 RepID=X1L0E4_9ZZZZ
MRKKVVVKVYKDPKKYRRDVKKMARKGYTVTSIVGGPDRKRLSAILLKGWFLAKRRTELVVTYER